MSSVKVENYNNIIISRKGVLTLDYFDAVTNDAFFKIQNATNSYVSSSDFEIYLD